MSRNNQPIFLQDLSDIICMTWFDNNPPHPGFQLNIYFNVVTSIVTFIPQEWRDYDCSFIITRLKFTGPDPFNLLRHGLPKITTIHSVPFNAVYVNYNYICARASAVRSREQLCLFARTIECCLPNRSLERLSWITFPLEALNVKHLTGF